MSGFRFSRGAVIILVLMAILSVFFVRPAPYGQIDPVYFNIFPAPWFYVLLAHAGFALLLGLLAFRFDLYSWVDEETIRKERELP